MSVLERFASPLRSRDAAVRLRAVQKHPLDDAETLAELARSDPDPRVRKEAVRRIEAPRVLLELASDAGDDAARHLARARGEALLVKIAADDRDLGESRRALALLSPVRAVAEVACRARFEAVREEALAGLTALPMDHGERDAALAIVAGRSAEPTLRGRALAAIKAPAALLQVAVSADSRESAQAAVRRLDDPELLLTAAASGAGKSVRRLARRRAEELLPEDHPERVRAREKTLGELLARLADADPGSPGESAGLLAEAETVAASGKIAPALLEQLEKLRQGAESSMPRDGRAPSLLIGEPARVDTDPPIPSESAAGPPTVPPSAEEILTRLADTATGLSLPDVDSAEKECLRILEAVPDSSAPRVRLRAAAAGARARALEHKKRRIQEFQLAELADHAVLLAKSLPARPSGSELAQARRELARLVRRFDRMDVPSEQDAERFRAATQDAGASLSRAESARQDGIRQADEEIAALEQRLTTLETAEPFPLEEGEAALRELGNFRNNAAVWRQAGPGRQALFQRLQAALMPRLREAREIREWRHWSNLEEQAELIRRARALATLDDLQRVDRELAALERAWHGARHTGRDRGQELWDEWAEVRGAVLERVRPLREAAERELGAKLEGLQGIVEKAEQIADAADPRRAADMRALMPEWRERAKGVGKRSERLWKRFRAAGDRYFTELKVVRKQRYEELAGNLPIREDLIGRAKALAEQPDPEAVRSAVRDLMREWKESPPIPRKDGDRLWEEFRSACDAARDRFRDSRRKESAPPGAPAESPEATEADAELLKRIAELRAQPAGERRDTALSLWNDYRRLQRPVDPATGPVRQARETQDAVFACLRETFGGDSEAFAGTRLDQEDLASRLTPLLKQLETLAQPRVSAPSDGGVFSIAEHLQRTLQEGRAADRDAVRREDAQAAARLLERAHAAGPALVAPTVKTLARIEALARDVIGRAPSVGDGPDRQRRRGPRPPRQRTSRR